MLRFVMLLAAFAMTLALNIVSNGPALKRAPAKGASTVVLPSDKLAEAFKRFDKDGNGFLDEKELSAAFLAAGLPANEDAIQHSMSILDADRDGRISLKEFTSMASQNLMPSLAEMSMQDNGHAFDGAVEAYADYGNRRDRMLAAKDTKRYCAERCLATGYCDALEDFLHMSTMQVQKFCESCAGEDECSLGYA
jgi:hypothetical protein